MGLETEAIVVGLDADYALLEVQDRQTGCGRCHEPGGCGGTLLSQMKPAQEKHYRVLNSIRAAIGDHVVVTLPDGSLWRAACVAYLLPLCGLLLGAFIAAWTWSYDDRMALCGGLIGLLAGVATAKLLERDWTARILMHMRFKRDMECLK